MSLLPEWAQQRLLSQLREMVAETVFDTLKSMGLRNSGIETVTGDGSTKEFEVKVKHGLVSDKVCVSISSTRPTTSPPSYIYAYLEDDDGDGFNETIVLTVKFDTAPASGEKVNIYWRAEVIEY